MTGMQAFIVGVYVGILAKIAWDRLDEIETRLTRVEFDGIARRTTEATPPRSEG